MKKYLFIATALAVLAGCSDDTFVGDKGLQEANGAISFGFDVPATTRAGGSDAATALGNRFIVYGEKGDITNVAPTTGNLVFPNYQVNYAENTSYTTTSNTKNWEYVGYTHSPKYQANITRDPSSSASDEVAASNAVQTIKYWDYSAANYVFTAVSALDADIENDRVKIQKNEYGTGNYDKGYTITLAKSGSAESYTYPTLSKLYFSDRQVIVQGSGSDRNAVNAYGGNVTLTFRNLVSQIRAGVYETISGYAVTSIKFYVDNGSGEQSTEAKDSETSAFGAVCPNTKATNYVGTITVVYYSNTDGTAIENQPKVTASGTPATNLILGTNMSTISSTGTPLGTSSTSPTWDTSGGTYTEVLPQIGNTTNLKLKVDYTLWNSVSGETINVTGATAEVPAQYLAWKPNYKYTYLFKISDNTNGHTGSTGPEGLYPITFDALEIVATDGVAEYITTVSEPSITTFGAIYNTTDSKYTAYQTGKNEYQTQTSPNQLDIFATFVKGGAVQIPVLSGDVANRVNVYAVTTSDETNFPITEASVAERLAETTTGTAKLSCTDITAYTTDATYSSTSTAPSVVSSVPAEDGTTKTIAAVKLTGVQGNMTYALEFITYDSVTLSEGADLNGYYSESSGTYTKLTSGTYSSGTYYKQIKTYKVIKVVASGS